MNKKGIIDCGSGFSLWFIVILFIIAFIIGIFIGFKVDKDRSLEREQIEYECPVLFEQGNYLFMDGNLISPSGKRLKCVEVEEKEYKIQTFQVPPISIVHVWSDGVVTCQEYINKSHSFIDPKTNIMMDQILNPHDYPIYCEYKKEVI